MMYVYRLYSGNELVYVGKTQKIVSRIYQHFSSKVFDRHEFEVFDSEEKAHIEEMNLILAHTPKYNRTTPRQYEPHKTKNTVAITIRPEQQKKIRDLSWKERKNFSEMMRTIIDAYFEKEKK